MKFLDAKKKIAYQVSAWRDFIDTYIFPNRTIVETPMGFKMMGGASQHHKAMQAGNFEVLEATWLKTQLSQADVFVDIGANIGYFSCLARSLNKQVVAIEPLNYNVDKLLTNIEINSGPSAEVYPVALSSELGVLQLYGASSTGASLVPSWAGASKRISRRVPITTLDRLLHERFVRDRMVIKMDVEGAEFEALKGAIQTIERSTRPVWLIEITLGQFMPSGSNPNFIATFELFLSRGYVASLLTDRGLIPITRDLLGKWQHQNYSDYSEINYIFS